MKGIDMNSNPTKLFAHHAKTIIYLAILINNYLLSDYVYVSIPGVNIFYNIINTPIDVIDIQATDIFR